MEENKKMFSLLYVIREWCEKEKAYLTEDDLFTARELILESRNILDKIVLVILRTEIDNAIIIECLLKLSKIERIITVLNIMNNVELYEIACLLNVSMNSIYVQKKTALDKIKIELEKHFRCGVLSYKEI